MPDKTWTATDIKTGTMRLKRDDFSSVLTIMQGYEYIDSNGEVIEDLPKKTLTLGVGYASIPVDIQNALLQVFDYTHQMALIAEDMD